MKKELITGLFRKFEDARYIYEGIECWSARELQSVFNYFFPAEFFNITVS